MLKIMVKKILIILRSKMLITLTYEKSADLAYSFCWKLNHAGLIFHYGGHFFFICLGSTRHKWVKWKKKMFMMTRKVF